LFTLIVKLKVIFGLIKIVIVKF